MEKVLLPDDFRIHSENCGAIQGKDHSPQTRILRKTSFQQVLHSNNPPKLLTIRELQDLNSMIFIMFTRLKRGLKEL